jgi:hypothetical protein
LQKTDRRLRGAVVKREEVKQGAAGVECAVEGEKVGFLEGMRRI